MKCPRCYWESAIEYEAIELAKLLTHIHFNERLKILIGAGIGSFITTLIFKIVGG